MNAATQTLVGVARAVLVGGIGLLYAAVAYGLFTGRINLAGLLDRKHGGGLDPARVQGLIVTALLACSIAANLGAMEANGRISLPSGWLVAVLGGSHGIYVVRKFLDRRDSDKRRDR